MADIGHNGAPAVAQLSYSDLKLIRTRSAFQVVLEGPIEEAENFVSMFGIPKPGTERAVAVALLQVPAESEASRETRVEKASADARIDTSNRSEIGRQVYAAKTPGEKLAAKAALLCKDKTFRDWISMGMTEEMAAQWMRERLQIKSRGDLATDAAAQERFLDLLWQYEHREDPNA